MSSGGVGEGVQGLDAKGLMASFSNVKERHEHMEPKEFNNDEVYQKNLNEVGRVRALCTILRQRCDYQLPQIGRI